MPRVEIDLQRHPVGDGDGERVSVFGTVRDANGPAQEYSGWLELMAVLEDIARGPKTADSDSSKRPPL